MQNEAVQDVAEPADIQFVAEQIVHGYLEGHSYLHEQLIELQYTLHNKIVHLTPTLGKTYDPMCPTMQVQVMKGFSFQAITLIY